MGRKRGTRRQGEVEEVVVVETGRERTGGRGEKKKEKSDEKN